MLSSYFTILFRGIFKNKIFSFINIGGLALGLSCFTIILLYVENELSFDRFHREPESVYRIVKDFLNAEGDRIPDATTPPALSLTVREELPEVEHVTMFAAGWGRLYLIENGDKHFYETALLRVDADFFSVFDFQFIAGDKKTALTNIHSIILTQRTARKYFGNEEAIGKVLRLNVNNGTDYIVTGVLKDVPQNSHFNFELIIPFESSRKIESNWSWNIFYTYARLKADTDPTAFESHVKDLVERHQPSGIDEFYVQKLTDIHFYSKLKWELGTNGDILNVKMLVTIALLVMIIASINYVNLVTAQSTRRAKEVGIRKVTGAHRKTLVRQFLLESVLMVFLSLGGSVILTTLLLPLAKQILGYDLSDLFAQSRYVKIILPSCALIIGLLAGLYPSFYLSSFAPLQVLRGNFLRSGSGISLRRGLVVSQFVISSTMIIGTLIISSQLEFMKRKHPGFNKEHVMLLPNVRGGIGTPVANAGDKFEEIKKIPGVISIARADGVLGHTNATNGISFSGNRISLNFMRVDYEFLPTLQLELKEGRNFSEQFGSDKDAIVLNEKAVEQLGLKKPYLGQRIEWDDEAGATRQVTLVGIVKDFQFTSLREAIKPFGFILEVGNGSNFFLKLNPKNMNKTIADIEKVWTTYSPESPFEYSFQDQYLAKLNLSEGKFLKLFLWFTVLTILIACLGLFGLVTYLADAKTKEIGIRKVLGASVTSIVTLLSKEFFFIILIALVVAAPVAFFVMHDWLEAFAYRTELKWNVFVIAAAVSLLVAFIPISFQAIRAARTNPVDSLRRE